MLKIQLTPSLNRIIAKMVPPEDSIYGQKGKIILASESQDDIKSIIFRIVAVGSNMVEKYSVGDFIFKSPMTATKILYNGEPYYFLTESDIVGKLTVEEIPDVSAN